MTKLYKYRPLSELLFKELYYQEMYFSSYVELNDPLDLSARIEFTPKEKNQIESLFWFLFKTALKIPEGQKSDKIIMNNQKLIEFCNDKSLRSKYNALIFNSLTELATKQYFIFIEDLENVLRSTSIDLPFKFDLPEFNKELQRLTRKFLENSQTTCFSEDNKDFLMWSHYASKHSGLCLEFTLENDGLFPIKLTGQRKQDKEKYLSNSIWSIEEAILWEEVTKVTYQDKQNHINFFDFSPVFRNEGDIDLMCLSKSWTHQYANELKAVFSIKTLPWAYEKEWRAIIINFEDKKEPEERIHHYPIECLTGIYFGIRTPENVKKRIYKIFDRYHNQEIKYFNCVLSSGKELTFENWEYYDE